MREEYQVWRSMVAQQPPPGMPLPDDDEQEAILLFIQRLAKKEEVDE